MTDVLGRLADRVFPPLQAGDGELPVAMAMPDPHGHSLLGQEVGWDHPVPCTWQGVAVMQSSESYWPYIPPMDLPDTRVFQMGQGVQPMVASSGWYSTRLAYDVVGGSSGVALQDPPPDDTVWMEDMTPGFRQMLGPYSES